MADIASGRVSQESLPARLEFLLGKDLDDEAIDDVEDLAGDELEELEEEVIDTATAAKTVKELETDFFSVQML